MSSRLEAVDMKRWILIPMSLLTGMAAQQNLTADGPGAILSPRKVSECIKRLRLDAAPTFADGKPCMLSRPPLG